MPSLVTRIDRLEQNQLTGFEAAIREMPDDAIEAIVRSWDLATWGRVFAEAQPDDAEMIAAAMRQYGPGAARHG